MTVGTGGRVGRTVEWAERCGCVNQGDLEGLLGGRNFGKRLGKPLATSFSAARAGDAEALNTVAYAAQWFGRALYNLVTILDTEAIFVGGSVWRHNEELLAPLVQQEISTRFEALTAGVQVQGAVLGELVTDLGAFALVMPQPWIEGWRSRHPWTTPVSVLLLDYGAEFIRIKYPHQLASGLT